MKLKSRIFSLFIAIMTIFSIMPGASTPVYAARTKVYDLMGSNATISNTWLKYKCKPDACYGTWNHPNGKKIRTTYRWYKFKINKKTKFYQETGSDPYTYKRVSKSYFKNFFREAHSGLSTHLECKNGYITKIILWS